jgi:hypothetical protein
MSSKLPQIGQTYVSRIDPALIVYVVDAGDLEADGNNEADFFVEGCDPAYKDDTRNADGYDFDADSWIKHDFVLVSEHA